MNELEIGLLLTLVVLVVAAAVLGAAEAALLRAPRVRFEVAAGRGDGRAALTIRLLDDLPRVLNTVLLVVLLVQIGAATLAGVLAARFFGSIGVTIVSVILTFVLFVYSEAIPKTYAVRHPEGVARATAPLLRFLSWVLRPVVSLLVGFADLQAPGTGIAAPSAPTEDELLHLAAQAAATGTIEESDRVLMDRAFDLGDLRVDDIYVPRLDVVAMPKSLSLQQALDFVLDSGYRRIPIYDGDLDTIVGIVRLRDIAAQIRESPDATVSTLGRDPLVVPESRRVVELLADMQDADVHFAVVVDEHGGTAGIVTLEDAASRLIRPISSEAMHDGVEMVRPGIWVVAGATDTDDLARAMEVDLPSGEWTTVAGLAIGLAGRFLDVGEAVEMDGVRLEILDKDAHRITNLRVSRT